MKCDNYALSRACSHNRWSQQTTTPHSCTTRNSATTPFYRTYAQHAHDPQFAIVLRELSVIPCEWLPAIIADVELWALTFRLSINISYSSLCQYSTRQQICSFELGGDVRWQSLIFVVCRWVDGLFFIKNSIPMLPPLRIFSVQYGTWNEHNLIFVVVRRDGHAVSIR